MNVKKAIKKIAALGTGAALMGATVLGAMATDLSSFPEPFVKDGQFNAMIVIGEAAKTPDVIGAVDIATTLQYEMKQAAAASDGSATSVVMSGDNVQISLSSDKLTAGEQLGDVMTTLGSDELSALADDEFADAKYSQYIKLPYATGETAEQTTAYVGFFDDDASGIDSGEEGGYFKFAKDKIMYKYEMDFSSGADSAIATSDSKTLSGFEDKTIRFMGKSYSVINAEVTNDDLTLELMGGDVTDVIDEYATKTYTVNGKDYEIECTYVGSTNAKFKVNGQITDSLAAGETYTLSDDTEIGVREILENEAGEGGQDIVEFYLGADKIVLKDTEIGTAYSDWSNMGGAQKLEIGDENLENAYVSLDATNTSSTLTLTGISVIVTAKDNYYLSAGDKLSDFITKDKDVLFGNFDIEYSGPTSPDMSEVRIEPSGDNAYLLKFTNKGGVDYSVPIMYTETNVETTYLGASSNKTLWYSQPEFGVGNDTQIKLNDYFIVTNGASSDKDAKTRVFQYIEFDNDTASNTLTIEDIADDGLGEIEVKLTDKTGYFEGEKTIDGKIHKFRINTTTVSVPYEDGNIWVDLNGDGTSSDSVFLTDESGVVINLEEGSGAAQYGGVGDGAWKGNITGNGLKVKFTVDNDKLDETAYNTINNVTLTVSSNEVDFDQFAVHGKTTTTGYRLGDSDTYVVSDVYGMAFTREYESSNPDTIKLALPKEQKLHQVFVTSGEVVSSVIEGTSGSASYTVAPIQAGIAKLDTEVGTSWSSENVIVVGGPCVNSVAASLLGNPTDCAEGFTMGKAMVKLFPQGSKVAMLVAGYNADDTRRATKVVHNYRNYASSFKGSELEVAGTSMSDITVTSVQ